MFCLGYIYKYNECRFSVNIGCDHWSLLVLG